jgi:2-dehydro-3-deoxygluconokinase
VASSVERAGPRALCVGEALIAVLPDLPVPIEKAESLRLHVGGAEVNFAIGLARLGVSAGWVGRVGDDAFGNLVVRELEAAGVDTRWVRRATHPTGVYFREWLDDGQRRPYYFRKASAASELSATDWPDTIDGVEWVHIGGITPALGSGPDATTRAAADWAAQRGIPISLDPNFRPALWSASQARQWLLQILPQVDVLLMSEDEAELLFGRRDDASIATAAAGYGVGRVVIKRGDRGAVAIDEDGAVYTAHTPGDEIDPVGAGDAFDAGFVAATLSGANLQDAIIVGAYCGARAVEQVGEHSGTPTLAQLPPSIREKLSGRGPVVGGSPPG